MKETYNRLSMAQSYLSDALKSMRNAQVELANAKNQHGYLEERLRKIINRVHKFQDDITYDISQERLQVKGGES